MNTEVTTILNKAKDELKDNDNKAAIHSLKEARKYVGCGACERQIDETIKQLKHCKPKKCSNVFAIQKIDMLIDTLPSATKVASKIKIMKEMKPSKKGKGKKVSFVTKEGQQVSFIKKG